MSCLTANKIFKEMDEARFFFRTFGLVAMLLTVSCLAMAPMVM